MWENTTNCNWNSWKLKPQCIKGIIQPSNYDEKFTPWTVIQKFENYWQEKARDAAERAHWNRTIAAEQDRNVISEKAISRKSPTFSPQKRQSRTQRQSSIALPLLTKTEWVYVCMYVCMAWLNVGQEKISLILSFNLDLADKLVKTRVAY